MTNYYLSDEHGNITESSTFRFNENCLETEEEIVRNDEGLLMLQSVYDNYISTDEYNAKILAKQNEQRKIELLAQIDELDKRRIRAICEPSTKENGKTYLEYYTEQIKELRKDLAKL